MSCLLVGMRRAATMDVAGTAGTAFEKMTDIAYPCRFLQTATCQKARPRSAWDCDRGFLPTDDTCVGIAVPENAFLSESSKYGDGWERKRGFEKSRDGCQPVIVPANAHLRYDGASWECNKPFRERNGSCVER